MKLTLLVVVLVVAAVSRSDTASKPTVAQEILAAARAVPAARFGLQWKRSSKPGY